MSFMEKRVQSHTLRLGFISLWSFTFGPVLSFLSATVILTLLGIIDVLVRNGLLQARLALSR